MTDREQGSAHAMAKNRKFFFFLNSLIIISYARKRVFWCSLRSLGSLLSALRPKNKKKYAARSTQIFQFLIYWKRNAQQWIRIFSDFECFFFLFLTILVLSFKVLFFLEVLYLKNQKTTYLSKNASLKSLKVPITWLIIH